MNELEFASMVSNALTREIAKLLYGFGSEWIHYTYDIDKSYAKDPNAECEAFTKYQKALKALDDGTLNELYVAFLISPPEDDVLLEHAKKVKELMELRDFFAGKTVDKFNIKQSIVFNR